MHFLKHKRKKTNNGRIFYAVQATGNGHISRAIELIPYLSQYAPVDVFLSGNNSHLQAQLPVVYRSKGLSLFYGKKGGLHYGKMWQELNINNVIKEAKNLPVDEYAYVINDFESITSLACKLKNKPSVGFGHQASFQSANTPRPKNKNWIGEHILKNYAACSAYVGLHFHNYDNFIYQPIIKSNLLNANPCSQQHITVYLSHYSNQVIKQHLLNIPEILFEVFSKEVNNIVQEKNIIWKPINNEAFTQSLLNCSGVITGAGFETPAEALYLGKKLLCLPIKGQYEQLCNAAALEKWGVTILPTIDTDFSWQIKQWVASVNPKKLVLQNQTYQIVQTVMEKAKHLLTAGDNIPTIENTQSPLLWG